MSTPVRAHWRVTRRTVALLAVCAAGVLAATATAVAHPIHTTVAEVRYDPADRAVRVTLRVFADDFGAAVSRYTGVTPAADHRVPSANAFRYVRATFRLGDRSGRLLPLVSCGERWVGEVVLVCLRSPSAKEPRGLTVLSALLFEIHGDQVNIVQTRLGGRRSSLLFTSGDRARAIR